MQTAAAGVTPAAAFTPATSNSKDDNNNMTAHKSKGDKKSQRLKTMM
jgi:hypothetical protein